jgi:hypothetical protein
LKKNSCEKKGKDITGGENESLDGLSMVKVASVQTFPTPLN